jgi:alpha-tubulin suppressor-like RCC1 family protein
MSAIDKKRLAALAAMVFLAACGGGGNDAAPPAAGGAPTPAPTPTPAPAPAPAPEPPPPPAPAAIAPQLSAGGGRGLGGYALALRGDGSVAVLGSSTFGGHAPLGSFTPTTAWAGTSARVVKGLSARSVSAAELYALAVGTDGKLYGWGVANGGTLGGDVFNGYVDAPRALPGVVDVTMAVASEAYAVALRSDGTVWHWPGSVSGETVTPAQAAGLTGVRKIVRGEGSGTTGATTQPIAIKADGTAWALSWSASVAAGAGGPVTTHTAIVRQITGLNDVVDVSCSYHCLALLGDGRVLAWGSNTAGQLGNGTVGAGGIGLPPGGSTIAVTPTAVPGIADAIAIATTSGGSIAVARDGSVWTWGGDYNGQGQNVTATSPTRLAALPGGATGISCAVFSPCLVWLADGTVWGWGANGNGELADGSVQTRSTPVQAVGIDLD